MWTCLIPTFCASDNFCLWFQFWFSLSSLLVCQFLGTLDLWPTGRSLSRKGQSAVYPEWGKGEGLYHLLVPNRKRDLFWIAMGGWDLVKRWCEQRLKHETNKYSDTRWAVKLKAAHQHLDEVFKLCFGLFSLYLLVCSRDRQEGSVNRRHFAHQHTLHARCQGAPP